MLSFSSSLHLRRGHSISAASRRSGFVPELWSFHRVNHEDLFQRTNPERAASADITQIGKSITGHLSYALRVMFCLQTIASGFGLAPSYGGIFPRLDPPGSKSEEF